HRHGFQASVGLHPREDLVTVHLRHREIEQHRRRLFLAEPLQRLAPGGGGADVVVPRERGLLEGEDRLAVVDEEELRQAHGGRNLLIMAWSSAPLIGFSRKSSAPASRPFCRICSERSPVRSTTGSFAIAARASPRSSRVKASPSMPGMLTSTTITS